MLLNKQDITTTISVPKALYASIRKRAKVNRRSIHQQMIVMLDMADRIPKTIKIVRRPA